MLTVTSNDFLFQFILEPHGTTGLKRYQSLLTLYIFVGAFYRSILFVVFVLLKTILIHNKFTSLMKGICWYVHMHNKYLKSIYIELSAE